MTHLHPLLRAGALLALAGLIGSAHAAIGTAAGTSISNIAELDYTIGGVAQSKLKSCATACTSVSGTSTSFLVDNKIDLLVAIPNTAIVSAYRGATVAGGQAVASFTVTNQGNNVQDFGLVPDFSATGAKTVSGFSSPAVTDTFNPTACTAYIEDGTPGYQGTEPTYIDELASGQSATVTVACAIALTQAKAEVAVIALKATALQGGAAGQGGALTASTGANDPAQVDIVFADAAGEGGDLARAADHSAYNAFKVAVAELKTSKTVATLCDPLNGNSTPRDIPGAYVRYTITITNEGLAGDPDATDATLGLLNDTLAGALSFDEDLIKGDTAAGCKAGGTPTSGAGKGFAVSVTNTSRTATSIANGSTVYRTGAAADADGAVVAGQALTLDFASLLPADGAYTAGLLKKGGERVTVVFNAKIN